MSKDNGGPAFPVPASVIGANGDLFHADAGMALRDYFAAKAMVGLMTMVAGAMQTIEGDDHLATLAYGVADAMLKERAK